MRIWSAIIRDIFDHSGNIYPERSPVGSEQRSKRNPNKNVSGRNQVLTDDVGLGFGGAMDTGPPRPIL